MWHARRWEWFLFFFSCRRRHTRLTCDWSSDVCSSDLGYERGRVREQAEGDPGVLDVMDRERAENVNRVVQRQLAGNDVLGHLVREHGRPDHEARVLAWLPSDV